MIYVEYLLAAIYAELGVIQFLSESRLQSVTAEIESFDELIHTIDEEKDACEELKKSAKQELTNEYDQNVKVQSEIQSICHVLEKDVFPFPAVTYFKKIGSFIVDLLWMDRILELEYGKLIDPDITEEQNKDLNQGLRLETKNDMTALWKQKIEEIPYLFEDYKEIKGILREKFEVVLPEISTQST